MPDRGPLWVATADFVFESLRDVRHLVYSDGHTNAVLGSASGSIILERCPSEEVLKVLASRARAFAIAGPETALEAQTVADVTHGTTYRVDALFSSFVRSEDDASDEDGARAPQPIWVALAGVAADESTGRRPRLRRIVGPPSQAANAVFGGYPALLTSSSYDKAGSQALRLRNVESWLAALDYSSVSIVASGATRQAVLALVPSGSRILSDGSGEGDSAAAVELRVIIPRVAEDQFVAAVHAARLGAVYASAVNVALV